MFLRILSILLLAALTARSQSTNGAGAGSTNAPPPALKALLQGMAASQPTNAKAGIYSTMAVPPLKTLLLSLDPTAKIVERHTEGATNFTCEWPDVSVRFTIQTNWNGPAECPAMKNWISRFPVGEQNTPAVAALRQKIDSSVVCIGSVITPGYDPAGKASSLVLELAAKLDGYIFAHQSFYDATGAKIIGNAEAPSKLTDPR